MNPLDERRTAAPEKKNRKLSDILFGIFFTLCGMLAMFTGKSGWRAAHAEGFHVQAGGALIAVGGLAVVVYAFRKK